jgi:hypothetical protein
MHNAHVQDVTIVLSNPNKEDGVLSQKVKHLKVMGVIIYN